MKDHQQAVLDYFDQLKPGKLLDAGSGGEALGRVLKEKGFDVVSLDLYSTPVLKKGFVKADLNAFLPFADNIFDYILCSESLQYLENHAGLFREFQRVLKKERTVILSVPNLLHADSRLYFLQRGYHSCFKPVRTFDVAKQWDRLVYNPISLVEILELAKRNNFTLKDLKASKMKFSPLYPFLKALYTLGLFFEGCEEKADLLRHLSSREALLGDHLIVQIESKAS